MSEISTLRLYLLRACYLLIAVGLAAMIWPGILSHGDDVPHMNTAVRSLLGAVSLLALIAGQTILLPASIGAVTIAPRDAAALLDIYLP